MVIFLSRMSHDINYCYWKTSFNTFFSSVSCRLIRRSGGFHEEAEPRTKPRGGSRSRTRLRSRTRPRSRTRTRSPWRWTSGTRSQWCKTEREEQPRTSRGAWRQHHLGSGMIHMFNCLNNSIIQCNYSSCSDKKQVGVRCFSDGIRRLLD